MTKIRITSKEKWRSRIAGVAGRPHFIVQVAQVGARAADVLV